MLSYRESTKTGDIFQFAKRTWHLEISSLQFFYIENVASYVCYVYILKNNGKNPFLVFLCILQIEQCLQFLVDSLYRKDRKAIDMKIIFGKHITFIKHKHVCMYMCNKKVTIISLLSYWRWGTDKLPSPLAVDVKRNGKDHWLGYNTTPAGVEVPANKKNHHHQKNCVYCYQNEKIIQVSNMLHQMQSGSARFTVCSQLDYSQKCQLLRFTWMKVYFFTPRKIDYIAASLATYIIFQLVFLLKNRQIIITGRPPKLEILFNLKNALDIDNTFPSIFFILNILFCMFTMFFLLY